MRCVCTLIAVGLFLVAWSALPAAEPEFSAEDRDHWSLLPRSRPAIPQTVGKAERPWARNPIDAFVLERLKKQGLRPSPEADRRTLARRLYFDLTGLPPLPRDVESFVSDPSPVAYEQLVDRLLASPLYGQRWGQRWLDVVRYAETEGFEYDRHRPHAWRYRDYVIAAFNDDRPFDQFTLEQLAGDEIAPNRRRMQVAVGLHRLGAVRRNAGNAEVAFSRNEVLTEMTDIIGSAFLGLSLACARCHDHMYDPIRQTDYYRLQAYLAATYEHTISLADEKDQTAWNTRTDAVNKQIADVKSQLPDAEGNEEARLREQIDQLESQLPAPLPGVFSVKNDPANRTVIHVLDRGEETKKLQQVGMRPLGVLLPEGAAELPADTENPRTILARWIVAADHPLTARVLANRIWAGHFGQGIVNTPNDFGLNGAEPSHAELLDFLANELVEGGWRIKPLHRLILLSSTYRQSSRSEDEKRAVAVDPENQLLWRFNRRRLHAEEIRDAMLHIADSLNFMAVGPSVIVPIDPKLVQLLYKPSQWSVTKDRAEHYRRSIYLLAKRNLRLPFMEVFDQPDLQTSCAKRVSSTHAPQALELLNGELANELADALAARLLREAGGDPVRQITLAFQYAAGRRPTDDEMEISQQFLQSQPLREFALAMFSLNGFMYVD